MKPQIFPIVSTREKFHKRSNFWTRARRMSFPREEKQQQQKPGLCVVEDDVQKPKAVRAETSLLLLRAVFRTASAQVLTEWSTQEPSKAQAKSSMKAGGKGKDRNAEETGSDHRGLGSLQLEFHPCSSRKVTKGFKQTDTSIQWFWKFSLLRFLC